MTDEQDPTGQTDEDIAAWSKGLATVEVDDGISQQIARRARVDLATGPRRKLALPIIAGTIAASYLAWTIFKLIEILG